jgi:hypothetical protein
MVNANRPPADVLDELAAQVQYEGDTEEAEYATSVAFEYDHGAFANLREAFLYEAHSLIRAIARTWAPLGTPAEAGQIAAWGDNTPHESLLLLALFRKADVLGSLAVHERRGGREFAIVLRVTVRCDADPQPGGGEGDEARAAVGLPRIRPSK